MENKLLSNLLSENLIKINTTLDSVDAICEMLVDEFYDSVILPEPKHVIMHKLMERERQESTVFSTGFALPHIHLNNFDDTLIGIAIPSEPIQTEDGIVKIIFVIISGIAQNSQYLKILQSLIKISKSTEMFNHLLSSKSPHEFIRIATEDDTSSKKNLTVSDLMNKQIFFINQESTLLELGNAFYQNNHGYCPIIDDDQQLIGEVTILDFIMTGFPEYSTYLESKDTANGFDPFEKLMSEESTLLVKDICKKIDCSLSPDDSIVDAVYLMKKYNKRDLPVIKDNKVIGIISYIDIFRKIIRG